MDKVLARFDGLIKKIQETLDADYDVALIEEDCIGLMNLISENPSNRMLFERHIVALIGSTKIPFEPIEFCMHVLRWDNVRHRVSELKEEANDLRTKRVLEIILESFDDDWYGRQMYNYFK